MFLHTISRFKILTGLFAVFLILETGCRDPTEKFDGELKRYTERPQNDLRTKAEASNDVAITGKLIPIDMNAKKISSIYEELPDDIRPSTPDEVKTVMWIRCSPRSVGQYSDGSQARSTECDLTFIDPAPKRFLWIDTVIAPPAQKKLASEYSSPDPTDAILDYLAKLPRR